MRLHYGKKQRGRKALFSFCRFEPRPLKLTHDFWCGCPQPGVLKIGKFPFEKNYSNAPKSSQALKSLISSGVWRFLILIFTGEKAHKIGSKKHLKIKKSRSENFCRTERTLENTGFSRVPLAERMGFEPMCDCSQTDFESAPLWPLRYLSVYVKHGQNTLNLKKEGKPKC